MVSKWPGRFHKLSSRAQRGLVQSANGLEERRHILAYCKMGQLSDGTAAASAVVKIKEHYQNQSLRSI